MTTPSQLTAVTIVPTKQYDGGSQVHPSRRNEDYIAQARNSMMYFYIATGKILDWMLIGHGVSMVENNEFSWPRTSTNKDFIQTTFFALDDRIKAIVNCRN
jgi:hypothetical protein